MDKSRHDVLLDSFEIEMLEKQGVNLPCFILKGIIIQQELELIKQNENEDGDTDLLIFINNKFYTKKNYMKNCLEDIFKIIDISGRELYYLESLDKSGVYKVDTDFLYSKAIW